MMNINFLHRGLIDWQLQRRHRKFSSVT